MPGKKEKSNLMKRIYHIHNELTLTCLNAILKDGEILNSTEKLDHARS